MVVLQCVPVPIFQSRFQASVYGGVAVFQFLYSSYDSRPVYIVVTVFQFPCSSRFEASLYGGVTVFQFPYSSHNSRHVCMVALQSVPLLRLQS